MTESQIYDTLKSYGFLITPYCSFGLTEAPLIDFFPVALKIESEKVVHKSNFGAVKLNINSMQALESAKEEIIANISSREVLLDTADRFIVTQMVSGIELYAGLVDDDIFGKTIVFGMGGVFLELYKDVCYIDLYADKVEIQRAIELTKISKVFDGFRNFDFCMRTFPADGDSLQSEVFGSTC